MNKGREIARGKTKILFEDPNQPDVLVVQQMDGITSGDGARRAEIAGKGRLAAKTTARVFRLLNLCGLPTHYLSGGEDDDDNEMLVRRCTMIPLEVVVRGVAAGSLVRRNPGIARGSVIIPRMIEFFFKDDANHDPLIAPDEIVRRNLATASEVGAMSEIARITYEILAHAWRRHNALLVDLKIEFGRLIGAENRGALVIADVIDNDSWRVWPQGREELMLDKQMFRNLETVTPEALERVKAAYEQVADLASAFPTMRPGMIALIADGPENVGKLDAIGRALAHYGLPAVRRVASAALVPGFVLQLVQQLDATFPRVIYVPVSSGSEMLATMLGSATTAPVLAWSDGPAEAVALACAKTLALDDTVMFGRTMLVQANSRTAVLQADAQMNVPAPLPAGTAIA